MSITYPLSFPGSDESHGIMCVPGILSQTWTEKKIAALTRSIFTGSIQVQEFQGEWLECTIVLPSMPREEAEPWAAFLGSLRGPVGSFLLGDGLSIVHGSLGVATGTPLVKGAGQTGKILQTDGWTAGVNGILKAGDFFSFGVAKEHLYKVMADVNSDGSGNADIDLFPAILDATTDDDVISVPGKGQFKILDSPTYKFDIGQVCRGLTFTAVQDI